MFSDLRKLQGNDVQPASLPRSVAAGMSSSAGHHHSLSHATLPPSFEAKRADDYNKAVVRLRVVLYLRKDNLGSGTIQAAAPELLSPV